MRFQTFPRLPYQRGYVPLDLTLEYYELYLQPSGWAPEGPAARAYSTYDFSSDLVAVPGRRPQRTVEQIIAQGYFAVPQASSETAIISDKAHTSHLGLDDIIHQIRGRYAIYERNLYGIELAKCAAINTIFIRAAELGFVPRSGREVYSLSKNMQALYQQEREERVSLWQDVSRLKASLPEAAQLYLSSYRMAQILKAKPGDAP